MADVRRRLVAVWLSLMGLTMALAIAGDVTHPSRLGAGWLALIAIVTIVKVRLVLSDYLGLRGNRPTLNSLTGAVLFTLAVVIGVFLAVDKGG